MSSGSASISPAAVAVISGSILLCGCTSWRCPEAPGEEPFLRVNHFSGGDGPVVYSLEAYEGELIRLNKVGWRAFCSTVESVELSPLRELGAPEELREIEWSPEAGHDWRMAQIQAEGVELRVVLDEPPGQVVPLLQSVDALFREHFGRRYDMPLLSE